MGAKIKIVRGTANLEISSRKKKKTKRYNGEWKRKCGH